HLPVAVAVMLGVAGLGAAVAVLADPVDGAAALAAVCAVPAALGGVAGAVSSVLGAVATASSDDAWSLVPPEVAGMRLLVRTALPPALAVAGTLPVLAARVALDQDGSPLGAAATAGVLVVSGFVAVASWVATRDQLHAWWRASMEQAFPSGDGGRREEGDADAA
ncbi:MAG TPA: hypothetical protein VF743_01410, partial [Acidimicrobiales bacterium]